MGNGIIDYFFGIFEGIWFPKLNSDLSYCKTLLIYLFPLLLGAMYTVTKSIGTPNVQILPFFL